ncbi:UbiA prenyltransferase family protein [Psychroserpens sp. MEBiC05023]
MSVLKKILDFYINTSVHVAFAVFALTWITLLQFDIDYDQDVLYFITFSTITGYNFVKYFGLAKFHHRSLTSRLKAIQIFSLMCFIVLCYYLLQLQTKTLFYVGSFGLVTFLYAIPLIPKKVFIDKQKNLRSISGLKIYVIALVWAGVTVFLPLINNDYPITNDVIITGVQRFVYVIVLMFPFEIRDLSYDSLRLSTIPQRIGVMRTKALGVVLLMLFISFEFLKSETQYEMILIQVVISCITFVFVLFAREQQHKYYSAFWVESLPIWWLILLLLFR